MTMGIVHSARDITITNGTNTSGTINVGQGTLAMIQVPAALDGGYLEFDVATTLNGTYLPLKDSAGNAIRYVANASTAISCNEPDFLAMQYIRIRTVDSGGNNINQTADRVFQVVIGDV